MAVKTKFTTFPLEGQRIVIDTPSEINAHVMSMYRSDMSIRPQMKGRLFYLHDINDWVREQVRFSKIEQRGLQEDEDYLLVIKDAVHRVVIGDIELSIMPFYVEIIITVQTEYQGNGVAEDAARMIMEYLGEVFPHHFFAMPINPDDLSQCNLITRLGFSEWPAVAYANKALYRSSGVQGRIIGTPPSEDNSSNK